MEVGDVNEIVKMLQEGVPVDCVGVLNQTALIIAARNNRTDIIRLLLQNGANVNERDRCGNTPVHTAVMGNSNEAIAVLIKHNINITNHKDQHHES